VALHITPPPPPPRISYYRTAKGGAGSATASNAAQQLRYHVIALCYHPRLYRRRRPDAVFLVLPAERDVERLAQLGVFEGEYLPEGGSERP
jgi:hypothetical protein